MPYRTLLQKNLALTMTKDMKQQLSEIVRVIKRLTISSVMMRTNAAFAQKMIDGIDNLDECLQVIRNAEVGIAKAKCPTVIEAYTMSLIPVKSLLDEIQDLYVRSGVA